jgi:hypothetical protein
MLPDKRLNCPEKMPDSLPYCYLPNTDYAKRVIGFSAGTKFRKVDSVGAYKYPFGRYAMMQKRSSCKLRRNGDRVSLFVFGDATFKAVRRKLRRGRLPIVMLVHKYVSLRENVRTSPVTDP